MHISSVIHHLSTLSVTMSVPALLVLFGSQTGTAQDTAQRIARQAVRRRLRVHLSTLDDYNVVSCVFFFLATT